MLATCVKSNVIHKIDVAPVNEAKELNLDGDFRGALAGRMMTGYVPRRAMPTCTKIECCQEKTPKIRWECLAKYKSLENNDKCYEGKFVRPASICFHKFYDVLRFYVLIFSSSFSVC